MREASAHPFDDEPIETPGDDWKATRLILDGGVAFPAMPVAFQRYWNPAVGWGFGFIHPWTRTFDFFGGMDSYTLAFSANRARQVLGLSPAASVSAGSTSLAAGLFGIRIHSAAEGLRPYAELGIGLPDVSRPAVGYDDPVKGRGTVQGAEIFALDPCYSVGGGIEYFRPRSLGGFIDARLIVAPGRTESAHVWAPIHAGISLSLRRLWPLGR